MNRKYSQEFKKGAVDQAGQPNVTLRSRISNPYEVISFVLVTVFAIYC